MIRKVIFRYYYIKVKYSYQNIMEGAHPNKGLTFVSPPLVMTYR